jgi:manganese-dependent inorganic pyrophosphatase
MMDSKVFAMHGRSLRVSVVETTSTAAALGQQAALREAMAALTRDDDKIDGVILFVVDILNEAATYVSASPLADALVESAWGCEVGADGTLLLPGVLSRKKQIIPALMGATPPP